MENKTKQGGRSSNSVTLKAVIIAALTIALLIPGVMIQELIKEREGRSEETIARINDKWSRSQILFGPVLVIPYTKTVTDEKKNVTTLSSELCITPEELSIDTKLFPEERHYGIYKTILYKSETSISGHFANFDFKKVNADEFFWDKAYVSMGFSDLRGITNNLVILFNGKSYTAETGGLSETGSPLSIFLHDKEALREGKTLPFSCTLNLNGSSNIQYVPVGKTTKVHVAGAWKSPGYIGDFSPETTPSETGFDAKWSVLSFNRNIPDFWTDHRAIEGPHYYPSLGVHLVDMVDHYQQNMRSAKYALLFIILTFVVFFFVELLTKKRIHPIQYLLVGSALLLFYTLLLSISEQLNFGGAYLIASLSTIGLITVYSHTIFKNKVQTGILAFTLSALYIFLYTVLQLEDIALLIGSIGLFAVLAIVMFISRKVNWYLNN